MLMSAADLIASDGVSSTLRAQAVPMYPDIDLTRSPNSRSPKGRLSDA